MSRKKVKTIYISDKSVEKNVPRDTEKLNISYLSQLQLPFTPMLKKLELYCIGGVSHLGDLPSTLEYLRLDCLLLLEKMLLPTRLQHLDVNCLPKLITLDYLPSSLIKLGIFSCNGLKSVMCSSNLEHISLCKSNNLNNVSKIPITLSNMDVRLCPELRVIRFPRYARKLEKLKISRQPSLSFHDLPEVTCVELTDTNLADIPLLNGLEDLVLWGLTIPTEQQFPNTLRKLTMYNVRGVLTIPNGLDCLYADTCQQLSIQYKDIMQCDLRILKIFDSSPTFTQGINFKLKRLTYESRNGQPHFDLPNVKIEYLKVIASRPHFQSLPQTLKVLRLEDSRCESLPPLPYSLKHLMLFNSTVEYIPRVPFGCMTSIKDSCVDLCESILDARKLMIKKRHRQAFSLLHRVQGKRIAKQLAAGLIQRNLDRWLNAPTTRDGKMGIRCRLGMAQVCNTGVVPLTLQDAIGGN